MHDIVHIPHTKHRQVAIINNKILHLTPEFISGTVMGVTIDAYKTKLLHALFIYAHSHDIVVTVVYIIVPNKPKATGLALGWNYKHIKVVKTIDKSSSFNGGVSSFRDETYLRIG